MKRIINLIGCILLTGIVAVSSCKTKEDGLQPVDVFTAQDFQYNLATKKFAPQVQLTGNIKSATGIKLVYYYLLTTDGSPQLVHTDEPAGEMQSDFTFTIPNTAFEAKTMENAQGLKIMVRHLDNSSSEGHVKIVPFTPEKPAFTEFPESIVPIVGGSTLIKGKITAESGLSKIEVYDNYHGDYELVETITGLNDATDYTLNYNYTLRNWASKIKLVATDAIGVPSEKVIDLDITYSMNVFFNVYMTAHGLGTNTIFFETSGTTLGNCSLNASEPTMAFLYYGTGSGPTFYSPTNTTNVAKNFKCEGASWVIQNPSVLRATRFRVLVKGSSAGVDNIYSEFEASEIENLDDAYFDVNGVAAPSGSSARFDPLASPTATLFNTTSASLIYVRIPDVGSPSTYKNALIRVKEATSSVATSDIKFDVMVQK